MTAAMDTDNVFLRVRNAAVSVYGETGWQRAVARDYNYSQSQLSKLSNGHIKLSVDAENRLARILTLLEAAETNLRRNSAMVLASIIDPTNDDYETGPTTLRGQINERFDMCTALVKGVINGTLRSVMISGPPGLGKSFSTMSALRSSDREYITVTGSISAPSLYEILYKNRTGLVLLDDCDKIWDLEDALNLLKGATNTDDTYRHLSWPKKSRGIFNGPEEELRQAIEDKEFKIAEEEGRDEPNAKRIASLRSQKDALEEMIPNEFDFEGGVIFITNKNITQMIKEGHKNAEHMKALIDRGFHLPLNMDSTEKKMERVAQGIEEFGILDKKGINRETDGAIIIAFMRKHADRFQTLSFRTAEKIGDLFNTNQNWRRITMVTQFSCEE